MKHNKYTCDSCGRTATVEPNATPSDEGVPWVTLRILVRAGNVRGDGSPAGDALHVCARCSAPTPARLREVALQAVASSRPHVPSPPAVAETRGLDQGRR